MTTVLIVFALLAVVSVGASVRAIASDGYRRAPYDPTRG